MRHPRSAERMHILFVNNRFPQPSQTFVLDQIRHARAAGHAVAIYAKRFDPDQARHRAADLHDVAFHDRPRNPATLVRLLRGLVSHPGRLLGYLRQRRALGLHLSDLVCALQVRDPPETMIANFGPNGVVAARVKQAFFPAARLAVIFHGFDLSAHVVAHGWEGYRRAAPAIDLAVTVNEAWARLLRENTTIGRVVVHHLGVDLDRIPPWRGHGPGPFTILFVGRIVEKKGLRVLIEALKMLKDRGESPILHAVGDGPERAGIESLVAASGLDDRVILHGSKPHDVVLDLMSRCDCLALPSLTAADGDQEGIPVTLMEAMACGLPVVSTHHSGIPELVKDGETGLLVPERDAGALAGALERLMAEEPLRRRLAAEARRFVEVEFNARVQNPALLALLIGAPQDRPETTSR